MEGPIGGILLAHFTSRRSSIVRTCSSCQKHQPILHQPAEHLRTSVVSCPFDRWSMDIVGPFPTGRGQKKFLFVAVDYFSKWSNGQTEVVNWELVKGLRVRLDRAGGDWVEELHNVLWAYRTTSREGTGMTPFHLIYGGEAVIPVEIGLPSPSIQAYVAGKDNAERRLLELYLISEDRAIAHTRLQAYRQRMSAAYNKKKIIIDTLTLQKLVGRLMDWYTDQLDLNPDFKAIDILIRRTNRLIQTYKRRS
ncbi:uncharacterized protein LOC141845975 [Curcuma longa]|uniref:uncharacterized protein LOC141845975 n=1 Tax=Curcuma longa TaxID=136217 RepID=UPI003D9E7172